jgi:hypothetical protein
MPEPRPAAKPQQQRSPNVQAPQHVQPQQQRPRVLLRPAAQRPAPRDRFSYQLR